MIRDDYLTLLDHVSVHIWIYATKVNRIRSSRLSVGATIMYCTNGRMGGLRGQCFTMDRPQRPAPPHFPHFFVLRGPKTLTSL